MSYLHFISPITFDSSIESFLSFDLEDVITIITIITKINKTPIDRNNNVFFQKGHSDDSIFLAMEPASANL